MGSLAMLCAVEVLASAAGLLSSSCFLRAPHASNLLPLGSAKLVKVELLGGGPSRWGPSRTRPRPARLPLDARLTVSACPRNSRLASEEGRKFDSTLVHACDRVDHNWLSPSLLPT